MTGSRTGSPVKAGPYGLNPMEWETTTALLLDTAANLFFGVVLAFGWASGMLFGLHDTQISQGFNFLSAVWFFGNAVFCAIPLFPSFEMRPGTVARVLQALGCIWNLAALCYAGPGLIDIHAYRILFLLLAVLITSNVCASDRLVPVKSSHSLFALLPDWTGERLYLNFVMWVMIVAQVDYMLTALHFLHRDPIHQWTGKSGRDVQQIDGLCKVISTCAVFQHLVNNYNVYTHFSTGLIRSYMTVSAAQSIATVTVLILHVSATLTEAESIRQLGALFALIFLKTVAATGAYSVAFSGDDAEGSKLGMSPPTSPRYTSESPRTSSRISMRRKSHG